VYVACLKRGTSEPVSDHEEAETLTEKKAQRRHYTSKFCKAPPLRALIEIAW
jgi:hypothetical protein